MDSVKLKIGKMDWFNILLTGASFGFLIALIFYFLTPELHHVSSLYFAIGTAILIALFSALLITISNQYILPKVNPMFWYIISFIFSFASGFLGFSISYSTADSFALPVAKFIEPQWLNLSITIGVLTFLIGLILHQFITMKYRHESANKQFTESRLRALENELNPHFLFNALNSMSELVYVDQKKAESSIPFKRTY